MATVSLRNLSKKFGDVNVITDINLEVKDGEFVSFLGPSGCGKTTTLRLIAGFERLSGGDILIGDHVVSSVAQNIYIPPEERNIGMVFQNYAVWPHMDVFANVAYPLKIKKANKQEIQERVEKSLSMVKLEDYAKRYPHQLSGGQQQRVALARALVMKPSLMLLDEPLSNLDAKLREEMRFEIKYLQKQVGFTIIYVTHDQTEAMAMSDRIMLMYDRKIQQLDTPRNMYERPCNKFVADFIGLINTIAVELVEVKTDFGVKNGVVRLIGADTNARLDVRVANDYAQGARLLLAVRPENIKMDSPDAAAIKGMITKKVYLGNFIDYRISLGEIELRVETPPTVEFEIGQLVGLSIEQEVIFSN
jgi:iron(III) transport system ATP-binding protein